jgi:hypothetical protein
MSFIKAAKLNLAAFFLVKPKLEKFCKSALKFVGLTLACWQAAIPLIRRIFFIYFNNLGATQRSGFRQSLPAKGGRASTNASIPSASIS